MFYTESITIGRRPSLLSRIWRKVENFCEVVGYARAAAELARLGYQEEAKFCMMQVKKLRD